VLIDIASPGIPLKHQSINAPPSSPIQPEEFITLHNVYDILIYLIVYALLLSGM
jgi:hypothetical protein